MGFLHHSSLAANPIREHAVNCPSAPKHNHICSELLNTFLLLQHTKGNLAQSADCRDTHTNIYFAQVVFLKEGF